jgi:hypothetical protein
MDSLVGLLDDGGGIGGAERLFSSLAGANTDTGMFRR